MTSVKDVKKVNEVVGNTGPPLRKHLTSARTVHTGKNIPLPTIGQRGAA